MDHVGHSTTAPLYYGVTDEKSYRYMQQVDFFWRQVLWRIR